MLKVGLTLFLVMGLSVASVLWLSSGSFPGIEGIKNANGNDASVFFADSVTPESLKLAYAEANRAKRGNKEPEKVKILIVPGHDAEFPGTEYEGLKEVELTVDLGERLFELLKKEPSFDVYISQTRAGYTPEFTSYFEKNRNAILSFIDKQKGIMQHFVEAGKIQPMVNVIHNSAPNEVALKLYGINKWANENKIDIIIHVHFNDYPGRKKHDPKYSGFAIYVPEDQYSNSKGSKSVAEAIYKRLATFYPHSDLPKEDSGIVEDQELIAIGSNNTLDAAGMLIEYGYIYEPTFSDPALRSVVLADLALQTYLGVLDFFGKGSVAEAGEFSTRFLPHQWQNDFERNKEISGDTLSLQAGLILEGVYPPPGEDKNDCSLTGYFGPCTEKSVKAFQEKYAISPAEGFVGEKTRTKLNELYYAGIERPQ